ncbi:sine oculis-binding protein homolog A-like, partial [Haemaphysalis longicornis]
MNELLGWYGYEKVVDRRDTQGLNLGHFAATSSEEEESGLEDSAGEQQQRSHKHRRSARLTPSSLQQAARQHGSFRFTAVAAEGGDDASAIAAPHVGEPGTSPRDDDGANLPPNCILCAWCQKVGMKLFTLKTTSGSKAFCSELCFTQCRR